MRITFNFYPHKEILRSAGFVNASRESLAKNKPVQNGVKSEEALDRESQEDLCRRERIERIERVSGELTETFQAYLDSCASEYESI